MKTIKPATLPAHEQAARRARTTVAFTPKPTPPKLPTPTPTFLNKFALTYESPEAGPVERYLTPID